MSNDQDVSKIRGIVEEGLITRVGDGTSTLFWHDKWAPSGTIKLIFPRLFSISEQCNAYISQMGEWQDNVWIWRFEWRRRLYDWEFDDFNRLKILVEQIIPRQGKSDGICWHGNDLNSFPTKKIGDCFYNHLDPIIPKPVSSFIWKLKAPPRAMIVVWLACLGKLKTGDFLVGKGLLDLARATCPLCMDALETNSHILFSCNFSWCVWMRILEWWGISGVFHNHCQIFAISWASLKPNCCSKPFWNLILACTIWSLWFQRNQIKFEGGSIELSKFLYTLKIRISTWAEELLGYKGDDADTHCLRSS